MIIYFVGENRFKFDDDFITINKKKFNNLNIGVFRYKKRKDFFNELKTIKNPNQKTILINIYSEDLPITSDIVETEERYINTFNNPKIIFPIVQGGILGNKFKTNKYLSKFGVLFPKIIEKHENDVFVFENSYLGSNKETLLLNKKNTINSEKYNTEFIDTKYVFGKKSYYASIRLLCVGGKISSIFLRFRDTIENNPNVHTRNTPLIPNLINSYYLNIILPNMNKLDNISKKIGLGLGLGFYVHDLGYSSNNNEFYVFESGFKLHDKDWVKRVKKIKNEILIDSDNNSIIKKLGENFIKQIYE